MKSFRKMDNGRQSLIVVVAVLLSIASASIVTYFYKQGGEVILDSLEVPESSSEAVMALGEPVLVYTATTPEIVSQEDLREVVGAPAKEEIVITEDDVIFALYDENTSAEEFGEIFQSYLDQEFDGIYDGVARIEQAMIEKEIADEAAKPFWKRWPKAILNKGVEHGEALRTE